MEQPGLHRVSVATMGQGESWHSMRVSNVYLRSATASNAATAAVPYSARPIRFRVKPPWRWRRSRYLLTAVIAGWIGLALGAGLALNAK